MSTIEKDKMKDLLKLHQIGPIHEPQPKVNQLNDIKDRLLLYAKDILDKEKHNDLVELFEQWRQEVEKPHDIFLNIIKYFVLSPVEKNYI